ncbi:MAG: substrate-binding domain-containing protein [Pirellulales bacterium]
MLRSTSALVLLLAIAAGCGAAGGQGSKRDRPLVAVIPKATSHEFWKSVHAGAIHGRDAARVDVVWKGPITESDREAQINLVQDFIAQGVDGICLAPLDSQALIGVVHQAKQAGIPVLIFDSGLDDERDIVSFVATDNYHGGQIAGRHLGKLLGGKGRVIILRQAVGSQSAERREQGCIDVLEQEFPEIEIISSNEYAGDTADKALVKSQQLLLTFGDRVDGIFTASQHVATGMLRALEEQNLAGKVKFVGFDSGPELVAALGEGKMHGIVLQDPVRMAELAVTTLADHIRGKKVERRIGTGETLATPDNMNQPPIERLLEPEQYEE